MLTEGPASFIHRLAGRAGDLAWALVRLLEILLLEILLLEIRVLRYDRRRERVDPARALLLALSLQRRRAKAAYLLSRFVVSPTLGTDAHN
jgi:hypothetical protein